MNRTLIQYRATMMEELHNILRYWQTHAVDEANGGFHGSLNDANEVKYGAAKGAVLNSRILWAFSAAFNFDHDESWLRLATRAYDYLQRHFSDARYGGVYWSVTANGDPLETRKLVYAQAFAIYALSEYCKCTSDEAPRAWAIDLYERLERHAFDPRRNGYFSGFPREWRRTFANLRRIRDYNPDKTVDTHLHVLEAYANLYRVWPDAALRTQIVSLVRAFTDRFVDRETRHLIQDFDASWRSRSRRIAYGHDIEAAWLLLDAAGLLDDRDVTHSVKATSIALIDAAARGLEENGGMRHEYDPGTGRINAQKIWWVQAEAMLGFFSAYQVTGEERYLQQSLRSWEFVQNYLRDEEHGEWHLGVTPDLQVMAGSEKVGFWKCPYHNGRACLEIARRIGAMSQNS